MERETFFLLLVMRIISSTELYLFILFLKIVIVVRDLARLCLNTWTIMKVKVLE